MKMRKQHILNKAVCLLLIISLVVPSVFADLGWAYAADGEDKGVSVTNEQTNDDTGNNDSDILNEPAETPEPANTNGSGDSGDAAVPRAGGTTSIMGQIHWDDTEHGWNNVIRPTEKPADPNTYINLWKYTGEDSDTATKVTLQSKDPSAPYYCVITPTEGIDYWTYSIANVPKEDGSRFYTTGPAFTGYMESERATEKPQTGELDEGIRLNYIEYKINYQPLEIKIMMKPASDTGKVGVNIKIGAGSEDPDKVSINYSGSYTVNDSSNNATNKSTSNGNIGSLGHNYDITLNEVPEGVSYKVTETGSNQYTVKYDGSEKGVNGASGTSTTITNLSNNAKATLTKKWNDNMDPGRSEEEFKKSLVLEYRFDDGDYLPETPESLEQQGIDGEITFEITDNNSIWEVKALHGGKENFPAVYEAGDNAISYRIVEKPMNGYVSSTDKDGIITNTKSTEFNATVNWHDIDCIDDRPEKVTYNVAAYYIDGNGKKVSLDNDFLARYGIENGKISVDVDKKSDSTDIHIEDIPMYSDNGYQISYSLVQDTPEEYVAKYDNKETNHGTNVKECFDGGVIDNVRTDWIKYSATKQWIDGGNTEARPLATVYLYRYVKGETAASASPIVIVDSDGKSHVISKTLNETDDMTQTETSIDFEDVLAGISGTKGLFKYDENGREYIYFVKEVLDDRLDEYGKAANPKYYKTYMNGDDATQTVLYNGGTLINSRIPMVDVSVTKTWKTASDTSAPKGTTVKFKILRKAEGDAEWSYVQDDKKDLEVTLDDFESEKLSVGKVVTLPKCDDQGKTYEYKLEEVSITAPTGLLGTEENILTDDGTMQLGGHTYTYSSETLNMESGDIQKPAAEDDNETATLTGYNTISDEMDYKLVKLWSGVADPSDEYSATMKVIRYDYQGNPDNSFDSSKYICELTSDNDFTYTYKNLPVYDSEGYQYIYRANETEYTAPEGEQWSVHYSYSYDKNKKLAVTTATNYHSGGDTYINVTKKWNDDGDIEARKKVVAQVYDADGNEWKGKTVTLSESNGWSGDIGFTDEEKDNLDEITVAETSVGGKNVDYEGNDDDYSALKSDDRTLGVVRTGTDGYIYKVENSKTDERHFNITNTRIGKTNVRLTKLWVDGNRDNDERPEISITLSRNNTVVDTYTVDKTAVSDKNSNEWIYDIENLEKYDESGKLIDYTISEVATDKVKADSYTSKLEPGDYDVEKSQYHTGDIKNYTLTNKREAETDYTVYKIWKDPETTTRRPDINVKLYYSIGDSEDLYEYDDAEGPLADYQDEELTYRWSKNPDHTNRKYDSTCTVKNLMKYSPEDGSEIHYYSMETMANRGEYKTYYWKDSDRSTAASKVVGDQSYAADGEYIENRVEAELSLKGVKYWNNMQAGTRPENIDTSGIMIALYQYLGEERPADFEENPDKYRVDEISLKAASKDNKNFAFGNKVPKYNEDGKLYNYEILETINGKLGFVYTKDSSGFALTNIFETGASNNRTISVKKNWNTDKYIESLMSSQDEFKYPKVTFELYRSAGISDSDNSINFNEAPYDTLTVNSADETGTITASFNNKDKPVLIWSENGIQYKYAVVEKIGGNILPAYTINTSDKTVAIDDGNSVFTPDNLPKEKTAEFTNSYEPHDNLTLKGKKVWKDANKPELRPEDITLEVYRKSNGTSDSAAIPEAVLDPDTDYTIEWDKSKENEWTYTITGDAIAEFAPNGQRWVYTVKEVQTEDITGNYSYGGDASQKGTVENGILTDTQNMNDITNTLKGEFTVSKSWDDNNNEYALRPTTSVVALKRSSDGGNTWEYVTTGNNTADEEKSDFTPDDTSYNVLSHKLSYGGNKWRYTFKNLAPNDEEGNPYTYEGVEIAVGVGDEIHPCIYTQADGKDVVLAGSYKVSSVTTGTETTLTNTLDPTEIYILKTWDDNSDVYDSRPKNADNIPQITVKLQRTLAKNAGDDNSWEDVENASGKLVTKDLKSRDDEPTWIISNLPKCDYSGQEYVYQAVEITEDLTTTEGLTKAYDTSYDYTTRDVTRITNSIIYSDTKTIKAEKTWIDGSSQNRPANVTLELTRWVNGTKVAYPEPMTIVLDGTVETEQNASYGEKSAWTATWTNLPKQDNQGNEITYKVEEIKIGDSAVANSKAEGYLVTSEYNSDTDVYSISNTEATEFTVEKTFAKDTYANRPANVTVKLQRSINGTDWSDVETRQIKGFTSEVANRSTTFKDLPKYDADDNLYTYRAIETKIGDVDVNDDNFASGYDVTYDNAASGATKITNTMNVVDISGYKTWDDQDNFYGLRYAPKDMKIKLVSSTTDNGSTYAQPDPVWENTDTNKWKFTFKGLPQYDVNGNIIDYKVRESVVPNGYTASNNYLTGNFDDADDGDDVGVVNGTDTRGIVNSLKTVDVTGTKKWSESVNGSGKNNRPDSITLNLMTSAGTAVTVPEGKLSWEKDDANNVWSYTFSDVPQCDKNGKDITYIVREDSVSASGYTASYDTAKKNITNTIDKTSLTATKVWDDQKNNYLTRPAGWDATDGTGIFTVYADYGDGNGPVEMDEQPECEWTNPGNDKKNYTFTVKNLQKYCIDNDGAEKEIKYSVKEDTVPANYQSSASTDGKTITNTLDVVGLTGTKVWVDNSDAYGTRPSSLTLTVERSLNGKDWETVPGNPVVTWTNADNNHKEWSYSYSGLPEKNLDGDSYTYRVSETLPSRYHTDSETALDKGTLTNTFDYGSIVIDKVFGEQMDNGTEDKPLATFTIENEAKTQKFVVKTDKNGNFVQAADGSYTDVNSKKFWLITGKYTIKETSVENAADGTVFTTDKSSYNFEISQNGGSAVITNATSGEDEVFVNNPARGNVTVLKIDDKYVYTSNSTPADRNTGKTQLAGAEFNLCLDEAGTRVITKLVASTANPGVYELPDAADGANKTNNLGVSYLTEDGLITGTYWLVETTSPEGYSINEDESPKMITVAPAAGTTTVADQTVDVGNTLIEKPFKISKTYEVPNMTAADAEGKKINEDGSSAQADADHKFIFTIERTADSTPVFRFKKTVTTDKDGIADFGNIPYGEYSVTETDTNPYVSPRFGHITVDSKGVHKGDSILADGKGEAYNRLKRGTITGTKLDVTSKTGKSVAVKDAVMGLYSGDVLLARATTDADGKYEFTNIPYGSYVVKEVKAPSNYALSNTEKSVSITEDDQTISLTGDNSITDAPARADLKLHKQQNENSNAAMKDVKFTLDGTDFMGNTITKSGTTNEKGELTILDLPVGSYKLTEDKVDDFEKPDSFNISVTNAADGNSNKAVISVEKVAAGDNSKSNVAADEGVYTVENTRIRRDFSFSKVSETDGDQGSPLAGAVFNLYSDSKCEGAVYTDEKCTGTATSEKDGKVTFENLPCGTWYIKETGAPSNFKPGTDIYKVTVDQDGNVDSNLKENVNEAVRGKLSVLKFDEKYVYADGKLTERRDDKEMLSDAEFTLCLDEAGEKVIATLIPSEDKGVYVLPEEADGEYKVNNIGVTYLKDNGLICGTYWIVETKNPEGYYTKTSECPQQITVAADTDTNAVADIPVNVANTMIEKPFKISKTYEIPNKVDTDADGSKIDQEGRWASADDTAHKFTFTVERTTDSKPAFEFSKSVSTDENGVADFGNLPYGKYTVTEAASDAYVTPVIGDITVDAEGVHQGGKVLADNKTDVANYLKRGKIIGTKMDVTSVNGKSVPVKGAVMGLYMDGVCVEKSTTDDKGKYEFTNITYGNYIVKEVKAPDNYVLSTTEKAVSITTDGQEVEIIGDDSITDPPAITDLNLHKIQNEQNNAVMQDVEFTLEGEDFMGNPIRKTGTTDADGNLTIENLPAGEYTLTETKVDDFEKPDSFNIVITSVEDGNSNSLEISVERVDAKDDSTSDVTADNGAYTVENTRIRRDFSFTKTGTDDELDLEHASPLAGAEFKVYDNKSCDGDAYTDEKCTGEAVSDKAGKVTFENLPCGTWYVKESKAPDNFQLDENVYEVTVAQDGSVTSKLETSVNEAIRGTLKFTTVDMNDPDKKVEGASYILYKLNKETGEYEELTTAVTDENGELIIDNLLIGEEYRLEEDKAPAGYQVSRNPIDFSFVLDDDKAALNITNDGEGTVSTDAEGNVIWYQPPTCVDISKVNLKGDMLTGASFEIRDAEGNVVESWISEESEHAVIAILTAGETYTLEELKAPDGYVTASPMEFTVEEVKVGPDGLYRQKVVMKDEATEALIAKVDDNGKPLKGASFKLSGKLADGTDERDIALDRKSACELETELIEGERYVLTETNAPDGYEKLEKPIVFRMNKDNEIVLVKYDKSLESVSRDKVNGKTIYTIKIRNNPVPAGGSGAKTGDRSPILIYFILMMMSAAMAGEVYRRRG